MPVSTETHKRTLDKQQIVKGAALAILYARYSDKYGMEKKEKENASRIAAGYGKIETSLETQITEEKELAKELGATVLDEDIYMEKFTGVDSIFDRPMIDEIRAKIRTRKYKHFIGYDTDRLARDIETAFIMKECMKYGCELLFVKAPIENSEIGQMILFMRGMGDRMEAMKFKDRVRRARAALTAAGRMYTSGDPMYGYQWDKELKVRAIDPETSKIVLMMFEWSAEGWSNHQIVKELNSRRIPSPSAGRRYYRDETRIPIWHSSQVQRILTNEQYTGKTFVDKHRMTERRRATGKYEAELKPRSEWVEIENPNLVVTPQLISPELFQQVQAGLRRRNKNKEGYNTKNHALQMLLRGILYCDECRCKMYPHHEKMGKVNAQYKVRTYRCSSKRTKGAPENCSGRFVVAETIETLVWNKVVEFFRQPEVVEREVRRILEDMPTDTLYSDLEHAETELTKKKKLYDKMYAKMTAAMADDDDILAERLEADCKVIAEEMRAYRDVINQIKTKLSARTRTEQIAKEFAEHCRKCSAGIGRSDMPFERKVQMLNALRIKVFAHHDRPTRIQTNLGALVEITNSDVTQTGIVVDRTRRSGGCSSVRRCRAA